MTQKREKPRKYEDLEFLSDNFTLQDNYEFTK